MMSTTITNNSSTASTTPCPSCISGNTSPSVGSTSYRPNMTMKNNWTASPSSSPPYSSRTISPRLHQQQHGRQSEWSLIRSMPGRRTLVGSTTTSATTTATCVLMYLLVILLLVVFLANTILLHQLDRQQQHHDSILSPPLSYMSSLPSKSASSSLLSMSSSSSSGKQKHRGRNTITTTTTMKKDDDDGIDTSILSTTDHNSTQPLPGTCAILFFGLPRSFQIYVLPSIIRNVVIPNYRYGCDYYLHYYDIDKELSSRSGRGGMIHGNDVHLLKSSIEQVYQFLQAQAQGGPKKKQTTNTTNNNNNNDSTTTSIVDVEVRMPHVSITKDSNESFWNARYDDIMKYRNTKDDDGNYVYFPYTEPTYVYPTTLDNIVKQWHSIEAVWNDMEQHQQQQQQQQQQRQQLMKPYGRKYRRIAMMRNDVIYITPIDIYQLPAYNETYNVTKPISPSSLTMTTTASSEKGNNKDDQTISLRSIRPYDYANTHVIIPDWANYPINDRLVIGPYDAVQAWATQRFTRIDDFAKYHAPVGKGMHSETFLNASIMVPIIQNQLRYQLVQDDFLCFLRVRADGAIWIQDCSSASHVGSVGNRQGFPGNAMEWLQLLLPANTTCRRRRLRDNVRRVIELMCQQGRNNNNNTDSSISSKILAQRKGRLSLAKLTGESNTIK